MLKTPRRSRPPGGGGKGGPQHLLMAPSCHVGPANLPDADTQGGFYLSTARTRHLGPLHEVGPWPRQAILGGADFIWTEPPPPRGRWDILEAQAHMRSVAHANFRMARSGIDACCVPLPPFKAVQFQVQSNRSTGHFTSLRHPGPTSLGGVPPTTTPGLEWGRGVRTPSPHPCVLVKPWPWYSPWGELW